MTHCNVENALNVCDICDTYILVFSRSKNATIGEIDQNSRLHVYRVTSLPRIVQIPLIKREGGLCN